MYMNNAISVKTIKILLLQKVAQMVGILLNRILRKLFILEFLSVLPTYVQRPVK